MSTTGSTPIPFLEDVINFIAAIGKGIGLYNKATSFYDTKALSDVTRLARVEPITVVSKDLLNVDYMGDIMQSLLSIFTAYYLQALALTARIDRVEIIKALDRLNPDRDSSGFLLATESIKELRVLNEPSYKYRLPVSGNLAIEDIEAADYNGQAGDKALTEVSNMAVGKVIQVTIKTSATDDAEEASFKIPVSIRLTPAVLSNNSISKILAVKKEDNTLVERYHSWRSGRIRFIQDLVLCQDLIDAHKKAIMEDEAGVYAEILRRVMSAKKYGMLTGNPSLVSASNIFVISDEVATELEAALGGKLHNPSIRAKAFENTYAMLILVVDQERQRVTFYTRGISSSADYSVKDLKMANKGKGIDIGDILKSFTSGSAPTF